MRIAIPDLRSSCGPQRFLDLESEFLVSIKAFPSARQTMPPQRVYFADPLVDLAAKLCPSGNLDSPPAGLSFVSSGINQKVRGTLAACGSAPAHAACCA